VEGATTGHGYLVERRGVLSSGASSNFIIFMLLVISIFKIRIFDVISFSRVETLDITTNLGMLLL
jgi:hypothetical protein